MDWKDWEWHKRETKQQKCNPRKTIVFPIVLDGSHQMSCWIPPGSFFRLRDLSREHSKQTKAEGFSALLRVLLLAAPRGALAPPWVTHLEEEEDSGSRLES